MSDLQERAIEAHNKQTDIRSLTSANLVGAKVKKLYGVDWDYAVEAGVVEAGGLKFRDRPVGYTRSSVDLEAFHLGSWHRVWDLVSLGAVLSKTAPEPQMTNLADDIADLLGELVEELVQEHCQGGERWNC